MAPPSDRQINAAGLSYVYLLSVLFLDAENRAAEISRNQPMSTPHLINYRERRIQIVINIRLNLPPRRCTRRDHVLTAKRWMLTYLKISQRTHTAPLHTVSFRTLSRRSHDTLASRRAARVSSRSRNSETVEQSTPRLIIFRPRFNAFQRIRSARRKYQLTTPPRPQAQRVQRASQRSSRRLLIRRGSTRNTRYRDTSTRNTDQDPHLLSVCRQRSAQRSHEHDGVPRSSNTGG